MDTYIYEKIFLMYLTHFSCFTCGYMHIFYLFFIKNHISLRDFDILIRTEVILDFTQDYYEWCIYIWNHMLMVDKFGWYWNVLKHLMISDNCMYPGPALQGSINIYFAFNTLRQRQNGCYFPDDIFKCIFLNENVWIVIKISLKFVPKGPINNIPALVQIMAWRRPGDKPLSEPMVVSLLTHICVTRPQWVNCLWSKHAYCICIPILAIIGYDNAL